VCVCGLKLRIFIYEQNIGSKSGDCESMTPCDLLIIYRRFGRTWCLHHAHEDGGITFLQKSLSLYQVHDPDDDNVESKVFLTVFCRRRSSLLVGLVSREDKLLENGVKSLVPFKPRGG
jgi:hypothetical protein